MIRDTEPIEITLLSTGTGNTASVRTAFERLGCRVVLTDDPDRVARACRLVVPGVGTFGAAMGRLRERGLEVVLRERLEAGCPTLGICLGMQMLFAGSEESPGVPGLGLLDAQASRFPAGVRNPQMGWNRVEGDDPSIRGDAYFANGFRVESVPPGWDAAWSDHGGRFIAALWRGDVLGCQFHPELSGRFGVDWIERWLAGSAGGVA